MAPHVRLKLFTITSISLLAIFLASPASAMSSRWGSYDPATGACAGAPEEPCNYLEGGGSSGTRLVYCDLNAAELLADGNYDKAQELLEIALKRATASGDKSKQVVCLKLLGLTAQRRSLTLTNDEERQSAISEAEKWYVDLLKIEPENLAALQALLAIYEGRGDASLATQIRSRIQTIESKEISNGQASACTSRSTVAVQQVSGILAPHSRSLRASNINPFDSRECVRFTLEPAPSWTFSGAFTSSGTLFLVDTEANRILSYKAPLGGSVKEITSLEGFCCATISRPTALIPSPSGYIVQYRSNLLSLQSNQDSMIWQFDITAGARNSSGAVTSLKNWTLAGSFIVGFGDIQLENGVYKSGLFQVPIANPSELNVLGLIETFDPKREFYWGGFQYLAAIGGKAYFVAMDSSPGIFEFNPQSSDPKSTMKLLYRLPVEEYKRPGLNSPANGLKEFFDSIEKAAIPTSLFASGKRLLLLARRPLGNSTEWEIFNIDPATGSMSRRPLPIHPKHITVIPGTDYWGFLEKGDYQENDNRHRQEIGSLLLVPREMLEGNMPICESTVTMATKTN